jgi:tetratricopeptide (TPR) repeat protein
MPRFTRFNWLWFAPLLSAICFDARAVPLWESQVIEAAGDVQTAAAGVTNWRPAVVNQILRPGDRLRTGADSRAALRLSDLSVIRVNELTLLEITDPRPPARHGFDLQKGALYFLNREKPADIEFQTPLATGAIRGTEFLLEVGEEASSMRLALFDGAVELKSGEEKQGLVAGEILDLEKGGPMCVSALLAASNLVQWVLYYPVVINPDDLAFSADEQRMLSNSLAAYRRGDLLRALEEFPANGMQNTDATRVYSAALKLAVGQVAKANELLEPVGESGNALRLLIAAVHFREESQLAGVTNSSGWLARSYYAQSRSRLLEAREAARRAVALAPNFGAAWARLAELEFDFGYRSASRQALARAESLSPRNAQAVALEGFIALADYRVGAASLAFDRALAMDPALPTGWVGRGLAQGASGRYESARRDLETAAALEPNRGLFRSYLGKAWSQLNDDKRANKEFALAKRLDPSDPTAWLYAALQRFQANQINDSIRDLERSMELNDNRSVLRSRLQLDHDQAMRSADLAAIYDDVGMNEVGARAAGRAIEESYSDFSGHLFLAQSLQLVEDPRRYDLRYETPRESELLVANLLAPPGGGNLSQLLSQQDRLQFFGERPFGFSSLSEIDSSGYWSESATAFGSSNGVSYALDGQYAYDHGQRVNNGSRDAHVSFQVKDQISQSDGIYFQAEYLRDQNGDIAQHYFPTNGIAGLRVTEEQNPNLYLGWRHEWSPQSQTLLLLTRMEDRLSLTNPEPSVLFLRQDGGKIIDVGADPFFTLQQENHFTLYSSELQQIWESEHQTVVFGGRYQSGSIDTTATLTRLLGFQASQTAEPSMERADGYGYYEWRPLTELRFTAGLTIDSLSYPRNIDLPPIRSDTERRTLAGPKAGFTVEPWHDGWLRGAWSRSLGGLFFDNSIRLEPSEVAGVTTAYRSLIPESVEGIVPGATLDVWTLGFDQRLPSDTYFGLELDLFKSEATRDVGGFSNAIPLIAVPNSPTSTSQDLHYTEKSFSAYANQLVGRDLSLGARYQWSDAALKTGLPELSYIPDATLISQDERSQLQHVQVYAYFNHPSGLFAEWSSDWYHQRSDGVGSPGPGDDFWEHNIFAGYRFAHRRAEFRMGVVNLTDRIYQLNPLNTQAAPPWRRTFTASLRLNY